MKRNPTVATHIHTPAISLEIVKNIFKEELKLADVPLGETFQNLAFSEAQLEKVRQRLYKTFGTGTRAMQSDTIFSYTDKLQK